MEFTEACKKIADLRLIQSSSGNLSQRSVFDSNEFYITCSGSWFEEISQEQIITCSLKTKKSTKLDSLIPSTELPMHVGILESRKDVNVVLHYQPVYGTIIACASKHIKNFNVIPEIPYYIGKIDYVPYYKPGSGLLSESVSKAIAQCNLVVMENHGLVVVGANFYQVIQRAIFFELACEIIVKSRSKLKFIEL